MNDEDFLNWLDSDEYYVSMETVEEEWPSFFDEHDVIGVTLVYENGETKIPRRDLRDIVECGVPRD